MIRSTDNRPARGPDRLRHALSFDEAVHIDELWDELRDYCRDLADEADDEELVAGEIRNLLDRLEMAGGLDARR